MTALLRSRQLLHRLSFCIATTARANSRTTHRSAKAPSHSFFISSQRRQSLRCDKKMPVPLNEQSGGGATQSDSDVINWYTYGVANIESYVDAAFRSSRTNEAYLFMKNEYVLVNYAPRTKDDKVVNGPRLVCDGFPFLAGTAFGEYGIECAFGSHNGNEAFIFCSNLCAHIDYAPGTRSAKIIKGPTTIARMFPFLKGTVFESGVDAAFEATTTYEAYLFKGDQYALINYGPDDSRLITVGVISQGFAGLKDTIFESGIDAAFASHRTDEAYIFKGDSYALINFAPGTTSDCIIDGVKQILPNWPSLHGILPRKNAGLDFHDHATPDADYDQDEF